MLVPWTKLIERLRSSMEQDGLCLPARPIADDRWHTCDAAGRGGSDGGAYMILRRGPPQALYGRAGCEIVVWEPGPPRIKTSAQENRLRLAAASCPIQFIPEPRAEAALEAPTPDAADHEPQRATLHVALPVSPAIPQSRRSIALGEAQEWLRAELAHSQVSTTQIQSAAAKAGWPWGTIRHAARLVGVAKVRRGFGPGGEWAWKLPTTP